MSKILRDLEAKGLRTGRSKMGRAARILGNLNVARANAIEKGDARKERRAKQRERRVRSIIDAHYARRGVTGGLRAPD